MSVAGFDRGDKSRIAGVLIWLSSLQKASGGRRLPLVVEVVQNGADGNHDASRVRKDANHAGAAFDLAVDPPSALPKQPLGQDLVHESAGGDEGSTIGTLRVRNLAPRFDGRLRR